MPEIDNAELVQSEVTFETEQQVTLLLEKLEQIRYRHSLTYEQMDSLLAILDVIDVQERWVNATEEYR